MSSVIKIMPYSLDLMDSIIEDIEVQAAKNVVREIIQCFDEKGFTIKIQHIVPVKFFSYYRVLCFIKKAKKLFV